VALFKSVTRTDIDEAAVRSYIREGGEVHDLLSEVSRGVKTYSVGYITGRNHIRSGRLLRGLWWNRTKTTGPLTGVARAGSSARHTRYFHDGTGTIVHPNMVVPKNRKAANNNPAYSGAGAEQLAKWAGRSDKQKLRGKGVTRENTVRGQRAKPFLTEGLAYSMAVQRLK
jgi:hypothetical protein